VAFTCDLNSVRAVVLFLFLGLSEDEVFWFCRALSILSTSISTSLSLILSFTSLTTLVVLK